MYKVLNAVRSSDWWEYKFPPILSIAYIISLEANSTFPNLSGALVFILAALTTGAIYVSILNDITDLEVDKNAGKANRMANFSIQKQLFFLFAAIGVACLFTSQLLVLKASAIFYALSFLSFSLYSLKPFRLKTKGYAGVIADAAGSQLFPTLFVAAYVSGNLAVRLNYLHFLIIGLWSVCFGLRGILWHQFSDLENDKKSGLMTVVENWGNNKIAITGNAILTVEIICFLSILVSFKFYAGIGALGAYLIYLIYSSKKWGIKLSVITPFSSYYSLIFFEFYQVFLPAVALLSLVFQQPEYLLLLAIHLVIFPKNNWRIAKNIYLLMRY